MTIWLSKTRKKQNLDLIRIKNSINKVTDNFITDAGYGHPSYNEVSEKYEDIYFLSKRNKRHFYNATVTSAIDELASIIYQKAWEDAREKYKINSSEYILSIDSNNLRHTHVSEEGQTKLILLCQYKDELIKQSLKDYTFDISNSFMYNYAFGIGLNFILPIKTVLSNDIVNEHIENFWNYDETHKLQKVTIKKDELENYMYNMLYISKNNITV